MPKPPDVSTFTFRSGVLLDADRAVLLAGHRELEQSDVPNTFVFVWKRSGEWAGWRVAWNSGSVARLGSPPSAVFVGEDGQAGLLDQSGITEGIVGDRRVLRRVCSVGERVYAVGLRGSFYERRVNGPWIPFEPDLGREADLEAVAGRTEKEMVAVGWRGQIWRITPGQVERLDPGTNLILVAICSADDDMYYACGQRGTLLRGGGSTWEIIEHDSTAEDLWDVRWFQGQLYVSSMRFLYRLEEDRLVRVNFDDFRVLSCYHLATFEDRLLWSIGSDDVMEYDGSRWQRIVGVDDGPMVTD